MSAFQTTLLVSALYQITVGFKVDTHSLPVSTTVSQKTETELAKGFNREWNVQEAQWRYRKKEYQRLQ